MDLQAAIGEGYYAKKQLGCRARVVAWSHRRRFATGLRLARQFGGECILDFGCGDGTLLALIMSGASGFSRAIGAELDPRVVDDCRVRFATLSNLSFAPITSLDAPEHAGKYNAVLCTEVLEHVVELPRVLDTLERLLTPDGHLIISVPVETGLPLLVKQTVRRLAAWRGIGDYPGSEPYKAWEYAASVFAGRSQHIVRPIHKGADGNQFHDHKGFNWMALRERLAKHFHIQRILSSPVMGLTPHLGTQAWFICTKRSLNT